MRTNTILPRRVAHHLTGIEPDRKWSPLLSPESWNEYLLENGFSGTDLIFHDFEDIKDRLNNVMVSTAKSAPGQSSAMPNIMILVSGSSRLQIVLAQEIKARLLVSDFNICEIVSFDKLAVESFKQHFCISLLDSKTAYF